MRAWAQKRPEPEDPGDIPEEFLKPFDWELEEEAPEPAAAREAVPAELLKPFAWESEEPRHEPSFELGSEPRRARRGSGAGGGTAGAGPLSAETGSPAG
ncbi:MAG: hypothetical protein V9G11_07945 [Bifidobacterium adolescentis]